LILKGKKDHGNGVKTSGKRSRRGKEKLEQTKGPARENGVTVKDRKRKVRKEREEGGNEDRLLRVAREISKTGDGRGIATKRGGRTAKN